MSLNSRITKLVNGVDDRGLSDIRVTLCVSIKLMPFCHINPWFPVEIHFFVLNTSQISIL